VERPYRAEADDRLAWPEAPPAKEPTAKRVRLEHLLQQFSEPLRPAQEPRLPEDHVPKYALKDPNFKEGPLISEIDLTLGYIRKRKPNTLLQT
jgi:hypothetical protein